MVFEIVRMHEERDWTIVLGEANLRPGRRQVLVQRRHPAGDERAGGCVGFRDDEAEAEALFDTVVRTVHLLTTGQLDEVDWAELPVDERSTS